VHLRCWIEIKPLISDWRYVQKYRGAGAIGEYDWNRRRFERIRTKKEIWLSSWNQCWELSPEEDIPSCEMSKLDDWVRHHSGSVFLALRYQIEAWEPTHSGISPYRLLYRRLPLLQDQGNSMIEPEVSSFSFGWVHLWHCQFCSFSHHHLTLSSDLLQPCAQQQLGFIASIWDIPWVTFTVKYIDPHRSKYLAHQLGRTLLPLAFFWPQKRKNAAENLKM